MRYEFCVYDNEWITNCIELMELLLGHGTKTVNYYLVGSELLIGCGTKTVVTHF